MYADKRTKVFNIFLNCIRNINNYYACMSTFVNWRIKWTSNVTIRTFLANFITVWYGMTNRRALKREVINEIKRWHWSWNFLHFLMFFVSFHFYFGAKFIKCWNIHFSIMNFDFGCQIWTQSWEGMSTDRLIKKLDFGFFFFIKDLFAIDISYKQNSFANTFFLFICSVYSANLEFTLFFNSLISIPLCCST